MELLKLLTLFLLLGSGIMGKSQQLLVIWRGIIHHPHVMQNWSVSRDPGLKRDHGRDPCSSRL